MEIEMGKKYIVRYGIGYGDHSMEMEFDCSETEEGIEDAAEEAVKERLWWSVEEACDE
jgi:hypothetical protein